MKFKQRLFKIWEARFRGESYRKIGKSLGLSGERVRQISNLANTFYRKEVKGFCEVCLITHDTRMQNNSLSIHHMDGNHNNNEHINLMTLCSECHRIKHIELKTYLWVK